MDSIVADHGLQLRQALERGLAQALIPLHPDGGTRRSPVFAEHGSVHGNDLGIEAVLRPRRARELLGLAAEHVDLGG